MKSAYELAMERLQEEEPATQPLSDETKKALADIDEKFDAKLAEREIFLSQQLETATSKGEMIEADAIRKQISNEKARIEDDRETAKDRIRNSNSE